MSNATMFCLRHLFPIVALERCPTGFTRPPTHIPILENMAWRLRRHVQCAFSISPRQSRHRSVLIGQMIPPSNLGRRHARDQHSRARGWPIGGGGGAMRIGLLHHANFEERERYLYVHLRLSTFSSRRLHPAEVPADLRIFSVVLLSGSHCTHRAAVTQTDGWCHRARST